MSKENKLVPKLRFPEFDKSMAWSRKKLSQYLLNHPEYGLNEAAVPFSVDLPTYLRITDISEDGIFLKDQKVSVKKKVKDESYLDEGDIVLARTGASVGKSYKYRNEDGRLVFAGFLIRLRPDKNILVSELLYQFFLTDQYWKWVAFTSQRSGQPGINGNEYASLSIPLPPTIQEQQKIADCLSSLDDLITAENEKLDALKKHKKGLMQQLFPAEGKKVPKLRFPEFKNSGEWEEKTLGNIAEIVTGNTPNTSELHYYGGDNLFVSPADIDKNRYVTQTKTTLSDVGFSKTRIIKANSVLFVCIGSTIGKIAQNKSECATNQQINSLIPNNPNSCDFLYSVLENLSKNIASLAGRQAVPIINKTSFAAIKISVPQEVNEQKKIGACFSSLDEQIASQAQKIENLKWHKKGLMQNLFPIIN